MVSRYSLGNHLEIHLIINFLFSNYMYKANMKVLLYGCHAWMDHQFISLLEKEASSVRKSTVPLENEMMVEQELDFLLPTHVVSFFNAEDTSSLVKNLFNPLVLAHLCREKNIHYTNFGTGSIFEYDEEHPVKTDRDQEQGPPRGFNESSRPNVSRNSNMMVAGMTDRLFHFMEDHVLHLRLGQLVSEKQHVHNFLTHVIEKKDNSIIPTSMSVLPELLPLVVDMMHQKKRGVVNLTNPGLLSPLEILEMYRDNVDPYYSWEKTNTKDEKETHPYLETFCLQKMYPDVVPLREAVRRCLVSYRSSSLTKKPCLLITGGCGFIGSTFINYYFPKQKFDLLVNFDAMYYSASETNVSLEIRRDPRYVLVRGNLCNASLVEDVLETHQITHVIHFAAQSHVQNSFEDSLQFTKDNILGTHVLLESCRKYKGIQKFIHVSTDEVYGESMNTVEETHKTEQSVLCPTNPYAATKAGAELIAQSYQHSYRMPILITRGNNVYGRNQYPEKLIPRFIELLQNNQKVTIQGDGSSVRAFLHASDTASAFEAILEKGEIGEIYNIGCDDGMEYSVMEIAQILIKLIKNTTHYEDWIEYIEDRPFNDQRYYISNEKVKHLGWSIKTDLLTGLHDLVHPQKLPSVE